MTDIVITSQIINWKITFKVYNIRRIYIFRKTSFIGIYKICSCIYCLSYFKSASGARTSSLSNNAIYSPSASSTAALLLPTIPWLEISFCTLFCYRDSPQPFLIYKKILLYFRQQGKVASCYRFAIIQTPTFLWNIFIHIIYRNTDTYFYWYFILSFPL